jgi:hypothetical protein
VSHWSICFEELLLCYSCSIDQLRHACLPNARLGNACATSHWCRCQTGHETQRQAPVLRAVGPFRATQRTAIWWAVAFFRFYAHVPASLVPASLVPASLLRFLSFVSTSWEEVHLSSPVLRRWSPCHPRADLTGDHPNAILRNFVQHRNS